MHEHRQMQGRSLVTLITLIVGSLGTHAAANPVATQDVVENSIGMPFVGITVEHARPNDEPAVASLKRRLAPRRLYYLGVYEVRQSDFTKVLSRNPSAFASSGKLKDRVQGVATDRLPVDSVSWNDAVAFCQALSNIPDEQNAGRRYRLPSSDEWEYAARAGSGDMWCYGNDRHKLHEYAWFGFDRCGRRPHVVGEKSANAFGLYDMYGNLWEWCQDPDSREAAGGSQAARSPSRIIRGGGWMSEPGRCNSVYWKADPPTVGDPDTGFRVVMEQRPRSNRN